MIVSRFRLCSGPLWFIAAYVPFWTSGRYATASVIVVWVLFVLIELSGARTRGSVNDFAAVANRLTYFAVFAGFSIVPVWTFVLILYREIGMLFVQAAIPRDGGVVQPRPGDKLKAVSYAISGVCGLLLYTRIQLGVLFAIRWLAWYANGAMLVSVGVAWVSFLDYARRVPRQRAL